MHHVDPASAIFKQSPTSSQLFGANKSCRGQIEALAAHTLFRLLTTGLGAVGKKVGAGDLALDQYGVTSSLPANGVRPLAASAGLFGEHNSAAIAAKPADSFFDQLGVSHEMLTLYPLKAADGSDSGASGIVWPLTWTSMRPCSCCFAPTPRNVSSRNEYANNRF